MIQKQQGGSQARTDQQQIHELRQQLAAKDKQLTEASAHGAASPGTDTAGDAATARKAIGKLSAAISSLEAFHAAEPSPHLEAAIKEKKEKRAELQAKQWSELSASEVAKRVERTHRNCTEALARKKEGPCDGAGPRGGSQ